jgi:protein involved in sex pheromone biosynthesis
VLLARDWCALVMIISGCVSEVQSSQEEEEDKEDKEDKEAEELVSLFGSL